MQMFTSRSTHEKVVFAPALCAHNRLLPGADTSSTVKCESEREEKLHENLGVIFMMGVILMWAESSAIPDPLFNILMYEKISK